MKLPQMTSKVTSGDAGDASECTLFKFIWGIKTQDVFLKECFTCGDFLKQLIKRDDTWIIRWKFKKEGNDLLKRKQLMAWYLKKKNWWDYI